MAFGLLRDFKGFLGKLAASQLGQLKAFAIRYAEAKIFEYIEYLKNQCPPPKLLATMGKTLQKVYKFMDKYDKKIELISRLPRTLRPPIRVASKVVGILSAIPFPAGFFPAGVIQGLSNFLVFLRKMVQTLEEDIEQVLNILNQARGIFNPIRARLAGLEGILSRCAETPKQFGGSGETWGRLVGSSTPADMLATLNLSGSNSLKPSTVYPVPVGSITVGDARMIITDFYTGSFTEGSFPIFKPLPPLTPITQPRLGGLTAATGGGIGGGTGAAGGFSTTGTGTTGIGVGGGIATGAGGIVTGAGGIVTGGVGTTSTGTTGTGTGGAGTTVVGRTVTGATLENTGLIGNVRTNIGAVGAGNVPSVSLSGVQNISGQASKQTVTVIDENGTSLTLGADDTVLRVNNTPTQNINTDSTSTVSSLNQARLNNQGSFVPNSESNTTQENGLFLPGVGTLFDGSFPQKSRTGFIPTKAFIGGTQVGFTPDERLGLIASLNGSSKENIPKFKDISYKAKNGNTYTLSILIDETSDYIAPLRYAIAKDFRGITILQGPKSFASSPQVLIDELKFRLDRQLP